MTRIVWLFAVIMSPLVSGCGPKEETADEKFQREVAKIKQQTFSDAVANLDRLNKWFDSDRGSPAPYGIAACKATIGILMGRDPRTMTATLREKVHVISYRRPDGDRWSYLCEATPTKVQWATFENGTPGSWRLADEVSYRVAGKELTVSMAGPETDKKTHRFQMPSLKQIN